MDNNTEINPINERIILAHFGKILSPTPIPILATPVINKTIAHRKTIKSTPRKGSINMHNPNTNTKVPNTTLVILKPLDSDRSKKLFIALMNAESKSTEIKEIRIVANTTS